MFIFSLGILLVISNDPYYYLFESIGVVISLTSVWIAILIVSAFIDRDIDLVFMIKSSLVVFLFFYILMLVIKIGVY